MTYDYEYEYEMLTILRLFKYLHLYRPEVFPRSVAYFTAKDADGILEDFYGSVWDMFADVEYSTDPDWETEIIWISDPLFDRFCELNVQNAPQACTSPWEAVRRKFQDMIEYYVISCTNALTNLEVPPLGSGLSIRLWLSPDIFEPYDLTNALINLMLGLRAEVEAMEQRLAERDAEIIAFPQNTNKEAA